MDDLDKLWSNFGVKKLKTDQVSPVSIFWTNRQGGVPVWNVVRYEQPNCKESKCRHTVDTTVTPMPMVRGYIACYNVHI